MRKLILQSRSLRNLFPILVSVLLIYSVVPISCTCTPDYVSPPQSLSPLAPTDLGGQADSHSQITIQWIDNSNNEDGFRIFRNGELIGSVGPNIIVFQDKGLKYASTYYYDVVAYNQYGEAACPTTAQVKTLNPPIYVTLDKIGVISDHDPSITGAGDIYLYIGVGDDKGKPQTYRIPSESVIKLKDNETENIGRQVFVSDCVGEELRIVAIAFESDAIHGLVLGIINIALSQYLGGDSGTAVDVITTLLKSQPATEEGYPEGATPESPEDDFVGAIEEVWTSAENWGVGSYNDVKSGDLRIWYTVSLPSEVVTISPTTEATRVPITPQPAPTPTTLPRSTPATPATKLSFKLSVNPGQEHASHTIPIYIKSNETLHLDWTITDAPAEKDYFWIMFNTPNQHIVGMRKDGGFNDYYPQGTSCEVLRGAGYIVFRPADHGWGEGYYYFMPHINQGDGPLTVEVRYWIQE